MNNYVINPQSTILDITRSNDDLDLRYLKLTGGTLTGALTITPSADGLSKFQVNDKDSNVILSVDTTNNRVGIGTTSPGFSLDIQSSSVALIRPKTSSSTSYSGIGVDNDTVNQSVVLLAGGTARTGTSFGISNASLMQLYTNNSALVVGTSDNYALTFGTSNTARITILGTGNVGIGTTSPASKVTIVGGTLTDQAYALTVSGTLPSVPTATQPGVYFNITSAGSTSFSPVGLKVDLQANYTGNAASHVIYGRNYISGGTGIAVGLTGDSEANRNSAENRGVYGYGANAGTSGVAYGGWFAIGTSTDGSALAASNGSTTNDIFRLLDNTTQVFTVKDGGNVGIGTTSPTALLDISGGGLGLIIGADDQATTRTNATAKNARIGIPHYTNSEEQAALISAYSSSSNNAINIGGGTSSFNAATVISFYTAANNTTLTGTERMRVDNNGNVGIGVTNPTRKLDVYSAPSLASGSSATGVYSQLAVTPTEDMISGSEYAMVLYNSPTGSYNHYDVEGIGVSVRHIGTGVVANAYGGRFGIQLGGNTGSITAATGIVIPAPIQVASDKTIGTIYGLSIGAQKASFVTTAYGIYASGASDLNYFAGNVGIGTTAPQSLLDVQGPTGTGTATAGVLTLATKELTIVDGDQLGRIDFNAPLESDGADAILVGASIWAEADDTFSATVNSTELVFATGTSAAATEKMRIDRDGNVGIGTTNPGSLLHIEQNSSTVWSSSITTGTGLFTPFPNELEIANSQNDTTGSFAGLFFKAGQTSAGSGINAARIGAIREAAGLTSLAFSVRGGGSWYMNEAMRINSGGNVGIGTTDPTQKLQVAGNISTNAGAGNAYYGGAWISDVTSTGLSLFGTDSYNGGFYTKSGGALQFVSAVGAVSTDTMILSQGNVGIGTTGPGTVLDVMSSSYAQSGINIRQQRNTTEGDYTGIRFSGTAYDPALGEIRSVRRDSTATFDLDFLTTTFGVGLQPIMTMKANGKVGIGTTSPTTRLEVEETKTITGAVTDGYAGTLTLDPGYTAATAQTVTRHNYMDVQNVSVTGVGPAAVTDACVMRFDAAAGTHLATAGATTKTTPSGVDAWLKININGTIYYMPAYTSTTA